LVVNYPNVQYLNPNQPATRAEVAAFIYQSLVQSGQAQAIASPYIVGQTNTPPPTAQNQTVVPAGSMISVKYEKNMVLLAPDEKVPLTLTVSQNVANSQGTILVPAGTQVVGELRNVSGSGGAQFFASSIVFANGQTKPINATSKVVTTTQTVNKGVSVGNIVKDAALGTAAAAAISAVTGDHVLATEKLLAGTGAGALLGLFLGHNTATLASVNPNIDLTLTLNSDLLL
jgi:hypothetical protein